MKGCEETLCGKLQWYYYRYVSVLTTITGWTLNDGFSQLVDSVESSGLKSKLIKFKDKGLEKPLYIGSVEPDQVIEEAYTYLGVPHRTGKRSRSGIDCSGLIAVSFDKFGIELPYSADEQARYGTVIPDRSSLRKGDLVFFTGHIQHFQVHYPCRNLYGRRRVHSRFVEQRRHRIEAFGGLLGGRVCVCDQSVSGGTGLRICR